MASPNIGSRCSAGGQKTSPGKPGTKLDNRKDGRYAGRVRLAVVLDRSAESLCGFVESTVAPGSLIVTDDWSGYAGLGKRGYEHFAVAECGDPEVAEQYLPIIHLVFANLKTWLIGIHHGVSHQHLQAYLNEFTFRFNRRLLDTVVQGIGEGIWVAQLMRPDRTSRTFWRTAIEEQALNDPALEVFLPEAAALSEISPTLLAPGILPGLWSTDEISVQDVINYFAGGHSVIVPKEGYDDTVFIPKGEPSIVEEAIAAAVERGVIWLINGPASIYREAVPVGLLGSSATLSRPPEPVAVTDLMEASIPDAWRDGKASALAIVTALSAQLGKPLPWTTVRTAIESGIQTRWVELAPDSAAWPCDFGNAKNVIVQAANTQPSPRSRQSSDVQKRLGTVIAEATLEANGIQDLADQIPEIAMAAVGLQLKFNVQIELSGDNPPDPSVLEAINSLLAEVSEDLKLR